MPCRQSTTFPVFSLRHLYTWGHFSSYRLGHFKTVTLHYELHEGQDELIDTEAGSELTLKS